LEEKKLADNKNENSSRKFYVNILLGTTLLFFATLAAYQFSHVVLEGQNYIASVNNRFITVQDFRERMSAAKKQNAAQTGVDFKTGAGLKSYTDVRKQVMNELILTKLLLQNASQENIEVSDDMIKEEINKIKDQGFHNNELAFKKAILKNGLTDASLNRLLRERLTIQKYTDKLFNENVKISDEDLKNAYEAQKAQYSTPESVEAAHILVKDENLANDILKQIKAGADFAEMAKKYSIDPGSKNNGGQLGYFRKGQMVPEFEKAAFGLKVGEVSNLVKTNFGYHIIKKTGYKPASIMPLEDVRKNLEAQLKSEKQRAFFEDWKTKALKDAEIKFNPTYASYDVQEKKPEAKTETGSNEANPSGNKGAESSGSTANAPDNQGTGADAKAQKPAEKPAADKQNTENASEKKDTAAAKTETKESASTTEKTDKNSK
jgi:foldase protein PrsA